MNLNIIAREAGVTAMTVSRVLRGQNLGQRRDAKGRAERICAIAERLKYRRNMGPITLATGRFNSVGILESTEWHRNYLPAARKQGIQDALRKHRMNLMIFRVSDQELSDDRHVPETFRNWMVDGFLIDYIVAYPARLDALIRRYALAAIWMNSKHAADCVFPADREGAQEAVDLLVKLGHRRIAYQHYLAGGGSPVHYSIADRLSGYQRAMRRAGLKPEIIAVPPAQAYRDKLAFYVAQLRGTDPPTALITSGLPDALAVVRAASAAGLRIPEDLSIITVADDLTFTRALRITAMEVPEYEVGYKAVECLMRKMAAPGEDLPPLQVPLKFDGKEFCLPPQTDAMVKISRRRRGGAKADKRGVR